MQKFNIINNNLLNKNFDKFNEVKRIYESGGELRELAGEDKARIFVKGKYYPAIITTRSLGDSIASQIGVVSTPHICRYKMDPKINYYLLMCTDGISNVVKIEDIVNIIENHDNRRDNNFNIIFFLIFLNIIYIIYSLFGINNTNNSTSKK
jgi:hypothetical protein